MRNPNLGLLLIRLGLAAVFVVSGLSKFMDIAGTAAFFQRLGLPLLIVYLVATIELLGGIAMLLGVWTRLFGWLLATLMIFAIIMVKYSAGFSAYRLDLLLLLVSLGIALLGPGYYALCSGDRCSLNKDREG